MKKVLWVAAVLLALGAYGCGGGSSSDPVFDSPPQVSGSIVLPEETDQIYSVFIDNDGNPDNGYVARYQNFCQCGGTVEFTFDGVPVGSYYIYAETFSSDGTLVYFGFYDPVEQLVTEMPAEPNVIIAPGSTYVFQFSLAVM